MQADSRQGMAMTLSGQCCDLPAILPGSPCSVASCSHSIYTGEVDGVQRANGLGCCVWHMYGRTHKGMFEAGVPCGWGTRTWNDGVVHQGFWKGHKLHGRGQISFVDGSTYHGYFVSSIRTGKGVYRSTSGFSYDGSWENDKPHGHGASVDDRKGVSYSGNWEFGQMHGFGVMTISESDGSHRRYEGNFVRGRREGEGVEELENKGTSYIGSWRQNLRHGIGTETILGKGVYVGEWQDNMRHGTGVYRSVDLSKCHYEGEWQEGLRHGCAVIRWNNGDSFTCSFVKGSMVGRGVLKKTADSVDHQRGASLVVHSKDIHTNRDGARASIQKAGAHQSDCTPVYFLLPAKTHSPTRSSTVTAHSVLL